MLAEKGVAGTTSAFEGQYGFFNTFFRDAYDREGMLADLGRTFRGGSHPLQTLARRRPLAQPYPRDHSTNA